MGQKMMRYNGFTIGLLAIGSALLAAGCSSSNPNSETFSISGTIAEERNVVGAGSAVKGKPCEVEAVSAVGKKVDLTLFDSFGNQLGRTVLGAGKWGDDSSQRPSCLFEWSFSDIPKGLAGYRIVAGSAASSRMFTEAEMRQKILNLSALDDGSGVELIPVRR
ncbi:hypothetical protein [Nocardia tengchongensis]|uniref:hypothetical protein n=1 Tax=Nocardia tengchongensis TaxID=2055889 RepID=UPI0036CDE6C1